MDRSVPRPHGADFLVALVAVLIALTVGVALGLGGLRSALVTLGAIGAVVVLARPRIGVYLLAATIPLETLLYSAEGLPSTRLLGMLLVIAWMLQKLLRRESWKTILGSSYFVAGVLLLTLILASSLWAEYVLPVRRGFIQLASLFALSLVVMDLCRTRDSAHTLVRVLVLAAAVAALLTLHQYYFGGLRRAGDEVAGGVNATAMVLVTLLPLGFYLLRTESGAPSRLLALISILATVIAILVTFSRMNMLLLPPLLAAMTYHTFRGRSGSLSWTIGLVAAAVVAVSVAPWAKLQERASSIAPYLGETIQADAAGGGETSPRGYHLLVGLEIARDHPIIGGGYGNYGYLFLNEYQFQTPGADRLYGEVRSPHSSYVGMLADIGILGLGCWVAVLAIPLVGLLSTLKNGVHQVQPRLYVLSQCLAYSLAMHLTAFALYLPNQKEKLVWLILGLAMAVTWQARNLIPVETASRRPNARPASPQFAMRENVHIPSVSP